MIRTPPAVTALHAPLTSRVAITGAQASEQQRFEEALRVEPAARSKAVDDQPTHLAQQLMERFGTADKGVNQDRLAMRAYLREQIPLGKRQERALLQVLGASKGAGQPTDYLASLIHAELKQLIPRNGMLDSLLRHSYKPDLE